MAESPTTKLEWSIDDPGCPACGGREVEVLGRDASGTIRGHCTNCGMEVDAKQIWEQSQPRNAEE